MSRPTRIQTVDLLCGYQVRLGLTDGSSKDVDLEPFFHGPIFEEIKNNSSLFKSVSVDSRAGTIVWPNGADIDPDVLCFGLEPCWKTAVNEPHPAA